MKSSTELGDRVCEAGTMVRLISTEGCCLTVFGIFMTTQIIPLKALECEDGEYEVEGQCCPTCNPGYRVGDTCNTTKGTGCVPCDTGTYTAHHSGLTECLQCKVCDAEFGQVTKRKCSSTSNAVCGCSVGYFCAEMKEDDCEMCLAHRVCTPGQYVKVRGTENSNTVCANCPAETFSPNGTLSQCLPWTNCKAKGLSEEKPGTNTTDAECLPAGNSLILIISLPLFIVIILIIFLVIFVKKKWNHRKLEVHKENKKVEHFCPSKGDEPDGSHTTIPVQETNIQEASFPIAETGKNVQELGQPEASVMLLEEQ